MESLSAILKGCWKATGKYPITSCEPIGEEAALPSSYWQKHGNFHSFPQKRCISVDDNKNPYRKLLKTLSGSSPN
jgi:hypothetical protein